MGTFEGDVAAAAAQIVELIPSTPAAALGRFEPRWVHATDSRVRRGLHALDRMVVERLLGALELAVDRLALRAPAELVARVGPAPTGTFSVIGQDSEAKDGLSFVELLHPGAADLVLELVESLRDKAFVADAAGDEESISARHGAAHLALAVAVSAAVLRAVGKPKAAAIIGVALGVTAAVLPDSPKPPAHAAAALDKRRAEYGYGATSENAVVTGHRFALADGELPEHVDFSGNGLVAAVPGGVVVRTGMADGAAPVFFRVSQQPPAEVDLRGWDEVVELSWTAASGGATLSGTRKSMWNRQNETPPWPGDYRALVSASGRDGDFREHYDVVVWQAPLAPEVVHKRSDRLGHRLRGEPEPPVVVAPEARYRWIAERFGVAATVTFVVGAPFTHVIRAFGANLGEGEPLSDHHELWFAATGLPSGLVVVVEENHYRGAQPETLKELSRYGRAASMFWNVNAVTRLSFARKGKVLASAKPGYDADDDWDPFRGSAAEVRAALNGIDFHDWRELYAKGVTAALRFVGGELVPADLDRLTVYPIAE
ncbi:hypothetical protein FKR81_10315 [Lentzea tibetensis]|uniref:Uncharacterized protein n=1 Tax=Lentzea tibetensis TaxID=2591470 RepID=A0A563EZZ8_9PSEU|nr:DUF6461 domain-containing protein [Lentzea tibetensis]TWP52684.1 hypothetical protein FKR81_10315 [Lentzea tibetensis]